MAVPVAAATVTAIRQPRLLLQGRCLAVAGLVAEGAQHLVPALVEQPAQRGGRLGRPTPGRRRWPRPSPRRRRRPSSRPPRSPARSPTTTPARPRRPRRSTPAGTARPAPPDRDRRTRPAWRGTSRSSASRRSASPRFPACALTEGTAARHAAACRSPASVASDESSASIASSPSTPRLTRRRSSVQRRSVSTASPSSTVDPSSSPARNDRSAADVATPANDAHVGELVIGPGRGGAEQRPQRRRHQREALRAPGRLGVVPHRQRRLPQQRLHDADVAHRVHAAEHQPDVVPGGHLPVPAHVPARRPDQRGRQRGGERADRGDRGAQRVVVEPDLGVGEVLVVDQHQVGPGLPDQLRHLGGGARHVGLDDRGLGEAAVRSASRGRSRCGASAAPGARPPPPARTEKEVKRPSASTVYDGPERVDPGGLQPLP